MSNLVTADARKTSGLDFMDAIGFSSPEERAARRALMQEQCIRAIQAGDTYGWPPLMVAECRTIIAERQALERDLRFTMELQGKTRAA